MDKLQKARKDINTNIKNITSTNITKLTYTTLIIKAISMAIHMHPKINSNSDTDGLGYTCYNEHNITVAIDTPHGLMIPTILSVQNLSLIEIQNELDRLRNLSYKNELPKEIASINGTITLSNLGTIGGRTYKPLIVPPQLAIIAIGSFFTNYTGETCCDISITADHRFLDGAYMARFSNTLKNIIENPI